MLAGAGGTGKLFVVSSGAFVSGFFSGSAFATGISVVFLAGFLASGGCVFLGCVFTTGDGSGCLGVVFVTGGAVVVVLGLTAVLLEVA